jgi:hypothetical protein
MNDPASRSNVIVEHSCEVRESDAASKQSNCGTRACLCESVSLFSSLPLRLVTNWQLSSDRLHNSDGYDDLDSLSQNETDIFKFN